MRINRRFQDYYDSALGYGADLSLYYDRQTKDFEFSRLKNKITLPEWISENPYHPMNYSIGPDRLHLGDSLKLRLVGFCGKIYPVMKRYEYKRDRPEAINESWVLTEFVYDCDRAAEVIKKEIDDGIYRRDEKRKHLYDFMRLPIAFDELFVEVGAPCFYVHPGDHKNGYNLVVTANPVLKDLRFYQLFDAFSAFQEISRYLGNVLTTREKTVEISDKNRIAQHGFDRTSFRHPTRLKDLK